MIITRTPFRVSFFGGGTDYPEWFRKNGGAVIATSIDKYCYLSIRHLPPFFECKHRIVYSKIELTMGEDEIEHPVVRALLREHYSERGVEIHHDGDLPARSGLGSSSAFTVGLLNAIHALQGRMISKNELAREAIRIEQDVLKENVGCQDQITTAHGGFNRIDFRPNGEFEIEPIILTRERISELESHLVLYFSGISRFSSQIAGEKIRNLSKRKSELQALQTMVDQAIEILQDPREPLRRIGELLHESWMLKRRLADSVSTPEIDAIYDAARDAGAIGGKVLGAGGGGFILFIVPPDRQESVRNRLNKLVRVGFRFETAGSRVLVYEPNGLESI